jgi:hypothetical protein
MINCPWCHNPFEPTGSGRCPHCGTLPPSGERPQVVEDQPAPQREAVGGEQKPRSIFDVLLGPEGGGLPWERRAEYGFWRGLVLTVRGVLFSPVRTFRSMSRSGGYRDPLSFAWLVCTPALLLSAGLRAGLRASTPVGAIDPWTLLLPSAPLPRFGAELGIALACAAALPALAALGAHLCLRAFRALDAGFEPTFRVICYAAGSTALLAAIPMCGAPLLLAWYTIAGTIGLWLVHRTRVLQALGAVVLPPAALIFLIGLALSIVGAATLAGAQ